MKPELLAPCHDWITLKAGVDAGADAVYFGVKKYNMRIKAGNFSPRDLPKISDYCHKNKVKCYLTLNVVVYENELKDVESLIKKAKKAKIDA
ncbi:MAG: U32 family peptidase, partial [Candidatus Omnitrophica bacterium]|nr:U32 family peptidase [Candidatus Omnitrophota bacterium]